MNIGVCGTGTIASWMSDTVVQMNDPDVVLYTCATSEGYDCTEFAKKFGYKKVSESFEALMSDPDVDLVYIAMPNQFHHDMSMKAIEHGKNLVCEKPFAVQESKCKEVMDAAHAKGLFVTEAMWTNFLPINKEIKAEIYAGTIGEVKSAEFVLRGNLLFLERCKRFETGGGVLLDQGPYTLAIVTQFLGIDIESIESETRKYETGVDAEDIITLRYKNGVVVKVHEQMDCEKGEEEQYVEIVGTKGKIRYEELENPKEAFIYDAEGNEIRKLVAPPQITYRGMPPVSGYEYAWKGYIEALKAGKKECDEVPNEYTVMKTHIMDTVLKRAGINFPF